MQKGLAYPMDEKLAQPYPAQLNSVNKIFNVLFFN